MCCTPTPAQTKCITWSTVRAFSCLKAGTCRCRRAISWSLPMECRMVSRTPAMDACSCWPSSLQRRERNTQATRLEEGFTVGNGPHGACRLLTKLTDGADPHAVATPITHYTGRRESARPRENAALGRFEWSRLRTAGSRLRYAVDNLLGLVLTRIA